MIERENEIMNVRKHRVEGWIKIYRWMKGWIKIYRWMKGWITENPVNEWKDERI